MPKKSFVSDHQKQQIPSMSPARSFMIRNAQVTTSQMSPLSEDDDDDDICPVCESECTCHKNPAGAPSQNTLQHTTPSFSSSNRPSSPPTKPSGSLKIKLTLPPHLKIYGHSPNGEPPAQKPTKGNHILTAAQNPHSNVDDSSQRAALCLPGRPPSRRPGRPPRSARIAQALAGSDMTHEGHPEEAKASRKRDRITDPSSSHDSPSLANSQQGRRSRQVPNQADGTQLGKKPQTASRSSRSLITQDSHSSDDGSDLFPTFMSAASISSNSTSSDSDSFSSETSNVDSAREPEIEHTIRTRRHKNRNRHDVFGEDGKRRDHILNRWEIRSRMLSVGPDGKEPSAESGDDVSDDDGAIAENEEDEDDAEADVENEGLLEDDEDEDDAEQSDDGKLGVSFDGVPTGWSEDEESSFDADLFFANLDGSSDSDTAPTSRLPDTQLHASDMESGFSADEDDALFLMDVDPSTHVRRDHGEFEFGIALTHLSSAWDDPFGLARQADNSDVEMSSGSGSMTNSEGNADMSQEEDVILEETDGETTEDELVDANGLPNSRAMMLFKWPPTVSTVDPQSTMSPKTNLSPPPNASRSVRIALASFSSHMGSPPPTPADILAGRVCLDDYDDVESSTGTGRVKRVDMGQFLTTRSQNHTFAIVDGSKTETPTPFPRLRVKRNLPVDLNATGEATSDNGDSSPVRRRRYQRPLSDLQLVSSDNGGPRSRTEASGDMSSTEAIELDDVLDPSILNADSPTLAIERLADAPVKVPNGDPGTPHVQSLNRWDRIPVATFRQTRETATLETAGSDGAISTPITRQALLAQPKSAGRESKDARHRRKASKVPRLNKFNLSPDLLPTHDSHPNGSSSSGSTIPRHKHQNKTKRDLRKDPASRKPSTSKQTSRRSQPLRHHHHHHYPNMKSRASSSTQRANNFGNSSSSVPHLSL